MNPGVKKKRAERLRAWGCRQLGLGKDQIAQETHGTSKHDTVASNASPHPPKTLEARLTRVGTCPLVLQGSYGSGNESGYSLGTREPVEHRPGWLPVLWLGSTGYVASWVTPPRVPSHTGPHLPSHRAHSPPRPQTVLAGLNRSGGCFVWMVQHFG